MAELAAALVTFLCPKCFTATYSNQSPCPGPGEGMHIPGKMKRQSSPALGLWGQQSACFIATERQHGGAATPQEDPAPQIWALLGSLAGAPGGWHRGWGGHPVPLPAPPPQPGCHPLATPWGSRKLLQIHRGRRGQGSQSQAAPP